VVTQENGPLRTLMKKKNRRDKHCRKAKTSGVKKPNRGMGDGTRGGELAPLNVSGICK